MILRTVDFWMPVSGETSIQQSRDKFGQTWIGRGIPRETVNLPNGFVTDVMIDVLCVRKLVTELTTAASQGRCQLRLELSYRREFGQESPPVLDEWGRDQ